jgi:hypothetical protein
MNEAIKIALVITGAAVFLVVLFHSVCVVI